MIGFAVTPNTAAEIENAIIKAFSSRDLFQFWKISGIPIIRGEYAGMVFISADENVLSSPLRGSPPMSPDEFPEFAQLIAMLGGLDARVNILPEDIKNTIIT